MQEIKGLLNDLRSENWHVRKETISSLLAYPDDSYLSVLEEWLRDDDALSRNAAMEAYRTLGKKAIKSLISLLKDDDGDIRIFTANILGDIKDAEAAPALISSLDDIDINVKMASAEALGKIGDERALEPLAKTIRSAQWVAMAAIEAIGNIGGRKALSILYKCLEDKELCGMALSAIEKTGNKDSIRYLTPYVDRGSFRDIALKAIVTIAEREKATRMPDYLMNLVPLLIELQNSQQCEIRKAAFIALSWAEDIAGLQYLINALSEEDLQEYAIKGILSLGKKAVPGLIEALEKSHTNTNRVVIAKALSMLGEDTALLRFADNDDSEVRTEVALAIAGLNTPKATQTLQKLARDNSEEVSAAAKLSLEKIAKKNKGKVFD